MLPDNLSGSYKAYKSNTNAFVTWLSRTALACGYKFPRPNADIDPAPPAEKTSGAPSTRLKGNARKEAKAAASKPAPAAATGSKQIVSTSDLLAQAKHIANYKKPPVKVPFGIQYVLRQSIKARQRCADWFQKAITDDNSSEHQHSGANASHQHFIGILQLAADILRPCFDSSSASNANASRRDSTKLPAEQNSQNSLNNRFDSLEIEDIDEHELHLMATAALDSTSTSSRTSKSQSRGVFELGFDIRNELPFIVFCFFEDMNKIREFLTRIWKDVAAEKLDSMAASITTNAALELVRKAEEEIILLWPELRNSHTFPLMLGQLLPAVDTSFSSQSIPHLETFIRPGIRIYVLLDVHVCL
jgi:hypothetical protein